MTAINHDEGAAVVTDAPNTILAAASNAPPIATALAQHDVPEGALGRGRDGRGALLAGGVRPVRQARLDAIGRVSTGTLAQFAINTAASAGSGDESSNEQGDDTH